LAQGADVQYPNLMQERLSGRRALLGASLLLIALADGAAPAAGATVTLACGIVPQSVELCRQGGEAWARARGQQIRVLTYPESSARARELLGELLQVRVNDLDVLEVDLVWAGMLAPHLLALRPGRDVTSEEYFPVALESFSVDGRLLAVPWSLSMGRLLYRTDLLERYGLAVPETWEEFAAAARTIQEGERRAGRTEFWGFVWQGRLGEGLTANALEWIASAGAPGILGPDGSVVVDDPRSAIALGQGASWVETISPGSVLEMGGEQSLSTFMAGNAAFLRYWSSGLELAQAEGSAVRNQVGMAALPAGDSPGGRHVSVLGGTGLAVSRYSKQQDLALDLIRWMTSAEKQKQRALTSAFAPTRPALYRDSELLGHKPFYAALEEAFVTAILRPASVAGSRYDAVSQAFSNTVHAILERAKQPQPALAELAAALRRLGPGSPRRGS
jgi:trehalose/maltose transport system substrate-binding protein